MRILSLDPSNPLRERPQVPEPAFCQAIPLNPLVHRNASTADRLSDSLVGCFSLAQVLNLVFQLAA